MSVSYTHLANVYFQIIDKYPDLEFEVIPGVTAATYSASALGAPLHDLAIISPVSYTHLDVYKRQMLNIY